MNIPSTYAYTQTHEWLHLLKPHHYRVGITSHAQAQLGDIVFMEILVQSGQVRSGQIIATIESVKAVAELYAPMDGEVVAIHQALPDHPQWLNEDPYEKGWIVELHAPGESQANTSFLSAEDYGRLVNG